MKWVKKKPKIRYKEQDATLDKIAKIRGISDFEKFLSPTEDELIDPYLMKNIEDASNRIIKSIGNGERICLSYDPDVDGISSTTTMYRYLKNYTDNVDFIYGERSAGHGIATQIEIDSLIQYEDEKVRDEEKEKRLKLNLSNIEKIISADLLIIIDSSSNDTETCEKIKSWGVDIIVLDHHEIEVSNPHVLMVNPQQFDCEYNNKHLSGAGVVFKVIQVMEDSLGQVDIWQYIDLVAIGISSDVMRMDVLENRFLVMHGLRNMRNAGLIRILKSANKDLNKLDCSAIGFKISPMINSVARMDNIKLAIDLLLEDDERVCLKIHKEMNKLNDERKEKQKQLVIQFKKHIDDSKKVLIVIDEQSSKGFNGLIAQQLSEQYQRPAIVGRSHGGTIAGSFRSYGGFDFKSFLSRSGLVNGAMGHASAGGISFREENLDDLVQYIEDNLPKLEEKEPIVIYDLEVNSEDIDEILINDIERCNLLTGNGFYKIVVKVNGITLEDATIIGKNRDTFKATTFDNIELIKFRVNEDFGQELGYFDSIDAIGTLGRNEWFNGKIRKMVSINQLILDDYIVAP